uniref:Uncharacterized protein n=1 Tax=Tanacetum cinerariifolium TaxID=118510 RepID=A0A699J505_TANCI|nr:hypothetical protein [Tanacetum cinerariifolium]
MIVAQQPDDVADQGAAGVGVNVDNEGADVANVKPSIPSPTPTTQPPPPSQELPNLYCPDQNSLEFRVRQDSSRSGDHQVKTKVVTAAAATITAATTPITTSTITAAPSAARRRKGVVIRGPEENVAPSIIIHSEPKSKDKGKRIMVEEPKPLKKQAQIEQDEAYAREEATDRSPARKNIMIYLRNMAGFKMDYFKGMSYDDIRPIFEKYFNSNVAFLKKTKERLEEEESKALKRKVETSKEKAVKKQKLDEEVEKLKKLLQIMPNDDDDVYTEATPLALKVPVIDYAIHIENNKPYYKIIRADRSHQLFLSFLSLLRNFDREDLEMLWQLVKERFASTKPQNFSDDFLLTTLTYIFEKPDVQAQVWKNQRSVHGLAKVKS